MTIRNYGAVLSNALLPPGERAHTLPKWEGALQEWKGFLAAGVGEGGSINSNDGDVAGMHDLGDAWAVKLSGSRTGIDELHGPVISIGANPCAGPLTISAAQDQGSLNITLIDAVGRQVLQERMTRTTHILDLSDRPCGVYLLSVRSANGVHTVRVVLE